MPFRRGSKQVYPAQIKDEFPSHQRLAVVNMQKRAAAPLSEMSEEGKEVALCLADIFDDQNHSVDFVKLEKLFKEIVLEGINSNEVSDAEVEKYKQELHALLSQDINVLQSRAIAPPHDAVASNRHFFTPSSYQNVVALWKAIFSNICQRRANNEHNKDFYAYIAILKESIALYVFANCLPGAVLKQDNIQGSSTTIFDIILLHYHRKWTSTEIINTGYDAHVPNAVNFILGESIVEDPFLAQTLRLVGGANIYEMVRECSLNEVSDIVIDHITSRFMDHLERLQKLAREVPDFASRSNNTRYLVEYENVLRQIKLDDLFNLINIPGNDLSDLIHKSVGESRIKVRKLIAARLESNKILTHSSQVDPIRHEFECLCYTHLILNNCLPDHLLCNPKYKDFVDQNYQIIDEENMFSTFTNEQMQRRALSLLHSRNIEVHKRWDQSWHRRPQLNWTREQRREHGGFMRGLVSFQPLIDLDTLWRLRPSLEEFEKWLKYYTRYPWYEPVNLINLSYKDFTTGQFEYIKLLHHYQNRLLFNEARLIVPDSSLFDHDKKTIYSILDLQFSDYFERRSSRWTTYCDQLLQSLSTDPNLFHAKGYAHLLSYVHSMYFNKDNTNKMAQKHRGIMNRYMLFRLLRAEAGYSGERNLLIKEICRVSPEQVGMVLDLITLLPKDEIYYLLTTGSGSDKLPFIIADYCPEYFNKLKNIVATLDEEQQNEIMGMHNSRYQGNLTIGEQNKRRQARAWHSSTQVQEQLLKILKEGNQDEIAHLFSKEFLLRDMIHCLPPYVPYIINTPEDEKMAEFAYQVAHVCENSTLLNILLTSKNYDIIRVVLYFLSENKFTSFYEELQKQYDQILQEVTEQNLIVIPPHSTTAFFPDYLGLIDKQISQSKDTKKAQLEKYYQLVQNLQEQMSTMQEVSILRRKRDEEARVPLMNNDAIFVHNHQLGHILLDDMTFEKENTAEEVNIIRRFNVKNVIDYLVSLYRHEDVFRAKKLENIIISDPELAKAYKDYFNQHISMVGQHKIPLLPIYLKLHKNDPDRADIYTRALGHCISGIQNPTVLEKNVYDSITDFFKQCLAEQDINLMQDILELYRWGAVPSIMWSMHCQVNPYCTTPSVLYPLLGKFFSVTWTDQQKELFINKIDPYWLNITFGDQFFEDKNNVLALLQFIKNVKKEQLPSLVNKLSFPLSNINFWKNIPVEELPTMFPLLQYIDPNYLRDWGENIFEPMHQNQNSYIVDLFLSSPQKGCKLLTSLPSSARQTIAKDFFEEMMTVQFSNNSAGSRVRASISLLYVFLAELGEGTHLSIEEKKDFFKNMFSSNGIFMDDFFIGLISRNVTHALFTLPEKYHISIKSNAILLYSSMSYKQQRTLLGKPGGLHVTVVSSCLDGLPAQQALEMMKQLDHEALARMLADSNNVLPADNIIKNLTQKFIGEGQLQSWEAFLSDLVERTKDNLYLNFSLRQVVKHHLPSPSIHLPQVPTSF